MDSLISAIEDIRAGKIVIVVDDDDRENEGDFICAAECITPEKVNFMATHGRGLICTPITEERADELDLWPMVRNNTSMHETAFTVSIDYLLEGCTTGISAYDRSTGIKALTKPHTKPDDYARPGHIFPLRAKSGGVLRRVGHTEAAVDLARLAGFYPAAVLVEILNEDGTMARVPQLEELSKKHDLKIISIKDLVAYRLANERLVKRDFHKVLNTTSYGEVEFSIFTQITSQDQHLVVSKGSWEENEEVPVRVQSSEGLDHLEHLFLDEENSDFQRVMNVISKEGKGVYMLMRHNEKMSDIAHTASSWVSSETTKRVSQSDWDKDIGIGSQILRELGVRKLKLITKSKNKPSGLEGYGLEVASLLTY